MMRHYDNVLVTGTPRGGTEYIRSILSRCGLGQFKLESTFKPRGIALQAASTNEVSGYSAPFVKFIWYKTYLVHQTRHPLRVAESLNANYFNGWLPNKTKLSYEEHIAAWIAHRVWPEVWKASQPDKGLLYWVKSHQAILEAGDRVRQRWRVEDLCPDDIIQLIHNVGHQCNLSVVGSWIEESPRDTNKSGPNVKRGEFRYDWDSFDDKELVGEAKRLAEEFGYVE